METLFKILEVFFNEPDKEFNPRQVSKKAKVAYGTAYYQLQDLATDGLLHKQRIANLNNFRANLKNEKLLKFFEYLELQRTEKFLAKKPRYKQVFEELLKDVKVEFVCLFGSFAKGCAVKDSDIDILIVGDKRKFETEIIKRSKKHSSTYGEEINPVFATEQQFEQGFENKEPFYLNLWRDRITLKGESLLWKTAAKHSVMHEQNR